MAEIPINDVDPNPEDTTTDDDEDPQPIEPFAERMARLKNESFNAALQRCGITFPPTLRYLNNVQNQRVVEDLAALDLSEIKEMVTVTNKTPHGTRPARGGVANGGVPNHVITAISFKQLKAFREWIKWRQACGLPLDADYFSIEWMQWSMERMDFETRNTKSSTTAVQLPEPLKGTGHKLWIPFWRQFQNHCRSIRGTLNVPIVYVFRDVPEPARNILSPEFSTSDEALIAGLSLNGTFYNEDNARVWDILESLTCDGNAWPFIKAFKRTHDGRAAILVLKGQSEGAASVATRKKTAYDIISTQTYDGKGRFTWDNYIEKLQFGFAELEECGDPQSESHKIHVLTSSCYHDSMKTSILMVLGDPDRFNTFAFTCEWLKSQNQITVNQKGGDRRHISSVQTHDDESSGELRLHYSQNEWKKLPASVKSRVIQLNRAKTAKRDSTQGRALYNDKRDKSSTPNRTTKAVISVNDSVDDDSPIENDNESDTSDSKPRAVKTVKRSKNE